MDSRIALVLTPMWIMFGSVAQAQISSEFIDADSHFLIDLTTIDEPKLLENAEDVLQTLQKKKGNDAQRLDELRLSRAILQSGRKAYDDALKTAGKIESASSMRPAAISFRIDLLLNRAARSLEKENWKALQRDCREAIALLSELRTHSPGPFENSIDDRFQEASLCLLRALVHTSQREQTLPYLTPEKIFTPALNDATREDFIVAAVKIYSDQGWDQQARLLYSESRDRYPAYEKLRAFEKKWAEKDEDEALEKAEDEPIVETATIVEADRVELTRAQDLLRRGDLRNSARIAARIYRDYPGSALLPSAYAILKDVVKRVVTQKTFDGWLTAIIKDVSPEPLYDLAFQFWRAEKDVAARSLLLHLVEKYPFHEKAGSALYVLGRIEENHGRWSSALRFFERLVRGYSNNMFYDRARFKIGWIQYILGQYRPALRYFTALEADSQDPLEKSESMFWAARIHEKMRKPAAAQAIKDRIPATAPLSYYAAIVQNPAWVDEERVTRPVQRFDNSFHLQMAERYLRVGMFRPARWHITQVQWADDPGALERAMWLSHIAQDHVYAVRAALAFMESRKTAGVPKYVIDVFFPIRFEPLIEASAGENQIDPAIVFSLIKQESAFDPSAVSRAGALGLMQLMIQTAREVSKSANVDVSDPSVLHTEQTNLQIGTKHLAQLLAKYSGNMVYAIAAYNAGSTRVDEWIQHWGRRPWMEFVELIPLEETRNYVKFILRNCAYYSLLLDNRPFPFEHVENVFKISTSASSPNQATRHAPR